jgi:hypothetical protein
MPLPTFATREAYVANAERYRPRDVSSIQWLGELERGWQANCRRAGREAYPPPRGEWTEKEVADAAAARERARATVEGFLDVMPTCALSREELVAGVLAEEGRDPTGRKR